MSDQHTYREHARELRARATLERDPGRQKYLAGLASSYEALAHRHGEPERPVIVARACSLFSFRYIQFVQRFSQRSTKTIGQTPG
jgi:hypothetical protein